MRTSWLLTYHCARPHRMASRVANATEVHRGKQENERRPRRRLLSSSVYACVCPARRRPRDCWRVTCFRVLFLSCLPEFVRTWNQTKGK